MRSQARQFDAHIGQFGAVVRCGIRLARSPGLSNNGTASGDSELKAAGFAGGHQAALGWCGHSGTIREQTVC
jgi:hypothetical protein